MRADNVSVCSMDFVWQGQAPLSEQEVDELLLFADPDAWENVNYVIGECFCIS